MAGVENANTLHCVCQASMSLPQEEERDEFGVELSPHWMDSISANILVILCCALLPQILLLLQPWQLVDIPCFPSWPFQPFHTRHTEARRACDLPKAMNAASELLNPRFLLIHWIAVAFYTQKAFPCTCQEGVLLPGRRAVRGLCCGFSMGRTVQGQATGLPLALNPAGTHRGCRGKIKKIVCLSATLFLLFSAQNFQIPVCLADPPPLSDGQPTFCPGQAPVTSGREKSCPHSHCFTSFCRKLTLPGLSLLVCVSSIPVGAF